MVIDTSAIIAMLLNEPERAQFVTAIDRAAVRLVSAVSKFEASMVMAGRFGPEGVAKLDVLLSDMAAVIVPFTDHHASIARDAFIRYGKGRHRAGLNFGDCAAYALATADGEPLLFKGTDFGKTDVEVVSFER